MTPQAPPILPGAVAWVILMLRCKSWKINHVLIMSSSLASLSAHLVLNRAMLPGNDARDCGGVHGGQGSFLCEQRFLLQLGVKAVESLDVSRACLGSPGGSNSKEFTCNAGDLGSIPGLGKSPGGGCDNPLQYSCLENPMDRGAWWATVHGIAKSWIQLND